jgi:MFS superfamily sulfate permease-like transporter
MACIGGILLYVSTAMVKPAEVKQVFAHNGFHIALMIYTAVVVVLTDFLIGVVTAIILWAALYRFFEKPVPAVQQAPART